MSASAERRERDAREISGPPSSQVEDRPVEDREASGAARASRLHRLLAWVPTPVLVGVFLELVFLIVLAATDGYDVARSGEVIRVVLTFATVGALFLPVHLAFVRRPRVEIAATIVVVLLFVAANLAKLVTAGSFDYGFVHDNLGEAFTSLGWHIMTSNVGWSGLAMLVGLPVASAVVLAKAPREPWAGGRGARLGVGAACVALLVALPAMRVSTHEQLTAFVASGYRFHAQTRAAAALIQGEPFPYVRTFVPSERARAMAGPAVLEGKRPHVIVLFMESWNGLFVDKKRPDGRPYTPVFDARRKEGLAFDHFYGNSIQSSRGHFATLCSLVPVFRGKEFTDYADARLHCLPQVLEDAGYTTLFYSATSQPDFERGKIFFEKIGFDRALFQDPDPKTWGPEMWGTGVQDDVFYGRLFARIDEAIAASPGRPTFTVAANASNHYPFRENPKHVRDPLEKTPRRADYVASIGAADAWLETFFAELEKRPALADALVVLVGDHSFPAEEHGIHFNGLGSYEEAFRTGFLLRWPGHVAPEVVRDQAASQLDIAPTLADLLQIRHETHFLGRSLLSDEKAAPIPMVQPYDGVRLAAVQWPFKLVRHEAAEQEQLYDLSRDPREERDLLLSGGAPPELPELRKAILRIHANQALLRANRVWPPAR